MQRFLPLPSWDQEWLDATDFVSIGGGASEDDAVRVFSSLNSPGALAPLLALSLLCYLTPAARAADRRRRRAMLPIALSLTFVRSAWVALIAGGHGPRGRLARAAAPALVLGAGAVIAALTIAACAGQRDRAATSRPLRDASAATRPTTSSMERPATLGETLPAALQAPLGHGLGTAGEASKLEVDNAELRAPDNGYLA